MRRFLFWITMTVIIIAAFTGCRNEESDKNILEDAKNISLEAEPIAQEQIYIVEGRDMYEISFEVPARGCIKMLVYDATEYDGDQGMSSPEYAVDFVDTDKNVRYEDISVTNGYVDKYYLEPGKVTAQIRWKNGSKKMEQIAVSWAYAKEEEAELTIGSELAVIANDKGQAEYKLLIEQDGLYRVRCAEACMYDWDCTFSVIDANGKQMADDIFIHGTEWISRLIFLPKGEYRLIISDVMAVAVCSVTQEESYDEISTTKEQVSSLPAVFGFTKDTLRTVSALMLMDGDACDLNIRAEGTNTYYDYEQLFDVRIEDSNGRILVEEYELEGTGTWNIQGEPGLYRVFVTPYTNGIIRIQTE